VLEFLRDPIGLLHRGYREHGELFSLRLGNRDGVVMIGPAHQRFFFTQPEDVLSIKAAYPFFVKMFDEAFYFFAEADEYRRHRTLLESRFAGGHEAQHIEVMADHTRAFLASLGDEGSFDVTDRLGPLVMRIAAHAFLGKDLGVFLGYDFFGEFRRFSQGMEPVLPLWLPLPRLIRSRRARDRLHDRLGELLRSRQEDPVDPPDFLQALVDASYPDGGPVPRSVIVNLALLLLWAGQETVTGHLGWALIDLLRHPAVLKDVLAEQTEIFGGGGDVTPVRVASLARLDRAVRESGRLHPVAHILMRSVRQPLDYAGFEIEPGTMLFVAPCVAHRLPEVFPDPDRYHPDRFAMADAAGASDPDGPFRLINFGAGPHHCPGRDFATLEIKVVLSLLIQSLDLELVDRDPQPAPGPSIKWPASPCRVRYQRRATGAGTGTVWTATPEPGRPTPG
jgi:sterol 14-demethylase